MADSTAPSAARDAPQPEPPATLASDTASAADALHWLRRICQLTDYEVAGTTADDWASAAIGIGEPSRGAGLQDRPLA